MLRAFVLAAKRYCWDVIGFRSSRRVWYRDLKEVHGGQHFGPSGPFYCNFFGVHGQLCVLILCEVWKDLSFKYLNTIFGMKLG